MPAPSEPTGEPKGRAWHSMELKINLGGYESVTIHLGGSMECDNTPAAIKRTQQRLARQHEQMLGAKGEELRELWGNTNGS